MNEPSEASPMDLGDLEDTSMDDVPMEMATPAGEAMSMSMDVPDAIEAGITEETTEGDAQLPPADRRKKAVLGVPIEVVISVGKARPLLSELVALRRDSVLMLDSKIEDPVEILVGDRVIARGELQEVDSDSGRLCVRLTEVADLSQSL